MTKQLIILTIIGIFSTHPLMAEDDHDHEDNHETTQEEHHDDHLEWTKKLQEEFKQWVLSKIMLTKESGCLPGVEA